MSATIAFDRKARNYNLALVIWLSAFVLLWAAVLVTLKRTERLPAPPITATTCIDEKFKFLHESELSDVRVAAIGSSVTLRSVNFGLLEQAYGARAKAINLAPCFLRMNQIEFLSNFYLDRMPQVHTLLSVFSMRDFTDCATNPTEFFDRDIAEDYVFRKHKLWHLYFSNFRPRHFFDAVRGLPDERVTGDLKMDRYGSGPLYRTPDPRRDVIVDPTCFAALKRMSERLAQRGIDFVAVLFPPMPAWLNEYDPGGARDQAYRLAVAAHVDPQHTVLIDTAGGLRLGDEHFTDPAHLQWESVPLLMQYIIEKIDQTEIRLASATEKDGSG